MKAWRISSKIFLLYISVISILLFSCNPDEEENPEKSAGVPGAAGGIADAERNSLAELFYDKYQVRCVDQVIGFTGVELPGFGREQSFGPPSGAGEFAGSLEIFILGEGKEAIFFAGDLAVKNGEGADFKVFENSFRNRENPDAYAWDLGFVEVSPDLENWYGFSPGFDGEPFDYRTAGKKNLAGLNFVNVNFLNNTMDPRLDAAGGDAFDLSAARRIMDRKDGNPLNFIYGNSLAEDGKTSIKYIKITDGGSFLPDGQAFSNGIDIDAICFFYFIN